MTPARDLAAPRSRGQAAGLSEFLTRIRSSIAWQRGLGQDRRVWQASSMSVQPGRVRINSSASQRKDGKWPTRSRLSRRSVDMDLVSLDQFTVVRGGVLLFLLGFFPGEDRFFERLKIFRYRSPYNIQINTKILVNEFVSHVDNISPRYLY